MSASDDHEVVLWDVARRRFVATLGSHGAPMLAVDFSPDGQTVVSAGRDGAVRLYESHLTLWGRPLVFLVGFTRGKPEENP